MLSDYLPFEFESIGKITFDYACSNNVNIQFRLEDQPYPNVNYAYNTSSFECVQPSGSGEVFIPSQGDVQFHNLILYLRNDQNVISYNEPITITNIKVFHSLAS